MNFFDMFDTVEKANQPETQPAPAMVGQKPVEDPKQVEDSKPVEDPKPVEDSNPVKIDIKKH